MGKKSGQQGVRSSPRVSRKVALDEKDGKTKSVPNNEDEVPAGTVRSEVGQDMTEKQRDELNEYLDNGGSTELVEDGHWTDKLSHEMKDFYDKAIEFAETLRGDKRAKFDALIEAFKHASSLERSKNDDANPAAAAASSSSSSSSSAHISAADKKHELIVANAGANAHSAAKTQGESEYKADAAMAKAIGKQEERRAEQLQREMEELKKKHEEALQKADEAHKKELVSVAKDAKEKAMQEAENSRTRSGKQKATATAAAAMEVENAVESAANTASIALSSDAANGLMGEILRSAGCDFGVNPQAEEEEEPKKGKGRKNGKAAPAKSAPAKSAPAKRKRGKDKEEQPQEQQEQQQDEVLDAANSDNENGDSDEAGPSNKKLKASDFYKMLGISGPSKLGKVVEEIEELKEEKKKTQTKYKNLRADRKELITRFNNAIRYMTEELNVSNQTLVEKEILAADEEEEEEQ